MHTQGVAGNKIYLGGDCDHCHMYGLVNVAAFLAQVSLVCSCRCRDVFLWKIRLSCLFGNTLAVVAVVNVGGFVEVSLFSFKFMADSVCSLLAACFFLVEADMDLLLK